MGTNEHLKVVIDNSFQTLLSLAAAEVLQATRYDGVCRPTRLRYSEKGGKVTISADKVSGKLAEVEISKAGGYAKVEDITPTSILTAKEAEELIRAERSFLPIEKAVDVLSRNIPEVNELVKAYFTSKTSRVLTNVQEVANLLTEIDSPSTRMLTALVTALDDHNNKHAADLFVNYKSFLKETPIGAEKIVRALRLIVTIAAKEHNDLMAKVDGAKFKGASLMKDALVNSKTDYDAARKIVGKLGLTDAFYPVLTMKAAHVYSDVFMRPVNR